MFDWPWERWLVFLIPFAVLLLAVIVWLLLRGTLRTRRRVERSIREDPDINEWLVVFGWSRKVLYLPTVAVSFIAAIIMFINEQWEYRFILGGIWFGVFFLNFLIDEYEMSVKVLLIGLLAIGLLFLWLGFLAWLLPFLRVFTHLRISVSGTGYLIIGLLFLAAIGISWIRGLFYYVAITPNYMNIQFGPTETGEQVSREEYSTRIDTGDFLERILGFGRVVVTFADQRRQPIMLLVGRVGKKAARLESIRGKLAFDRFDHPPAHPPAGRAEGEAATPRPEGGQPADRPGQGEQPGSEEDGL
jgi:hypothetical protein